MIDRAAGAEKPPVESKARVFPILLILLGLVLTAGGGWLASLGGSWYYLVTGLALIASGAWIWRGDARGGWLYALLLGWTLAWSLWEAGYDFWALLPRLALLTVLGLWLVTPWYRRTVVRGPISLDNGMTVLTAFLAAYILIAAAWLLVGDPRETDPTSPLPLAVHNYRRAAPEGEWHHYGNNAGGQRYSDLAQLTPSNVAGLEVAWTYHTGDGSLPDGTRRRFEVTPLEVGDTLYFCTPGNDFVALDAETGQERWRFKAPAAVEGERPAGTAACRGLAYYRLPPPSPASPASPASSPSSASASATAAVTPPAAVTGTDKTDADQAAPPACAERIYGGTFDARLVAVDARTGELCSDFGDGGQVDLGRGLDLIAGHAYLGATPQVVRGKVVVAGWMPDGPQAQTPSGVIRAYDARSGQFAWAFDIGNPGRHDEPADGEHYTRGAPNVRAPISADEGLGMIYVPTGNASADADGGDHRDQINLLSSSVIAIDADTGQKVWHFQTTHYDPWGQDLGSQPSLAEFDINGERIPALIQPTRRGQNFVLDRRDGTPVFEVTERFVPQGGIDGPSRLSATQPYATGMPAFGGVDPGEPFGVDEKAMWGGMIFDQLWCRIQFRKLRWEGAMTPPGTDTVLFFPGPLGGSTWGGVAIDPERRLMVGHWNRMPMLLRLVERGGADRPGPQPVDAAVAPDAPADGGPAQAGLDHSIVLEPFLSPLGASCLAPPYAMVTAVDLNNQRVLWERRSGSTGDSGMPGIRSPLPIPLGVPGLGGGITTRGGLVFIAASGEQSLRALDLATGEVLWTGRLPAGGNATPMSYLSKGSGRQFVVIAAGGHDQVQTQPGDSLVAFALPKKPEP